MNKIYLLCVAVLFNSFTYLFAQEHSHCSSDELFFERIKTHPEILQVQSELEKFTKEFTVSQMHSRTAGGNYIIPVVFHIVHNYGNENISDLQVRDAIRILNEDFQHRGSDTGDIVPVFKPIAADCQIEFRLATIDPNGACTNGIDRIASLHTYNGAYDVAINQWPPEKYLNIWSAASLSDGTAGFSFFPGAAPAGTDGIIILNTSVGSIGTGSLTSARNLTHLAGIFFNLRHPWGNTNQPGITCGDDSVADTPETQGWMLCTLNGSVCNPPIIENVQNFMEFSYCPRMFTQGQRARMHAALNSNAGFRDSLWMPSNLIATGTDVIATPLCAPVADYVSNYQSICAGDSIRFTDLSWNGEPSNWLWTFPGGVPATSADSMPMVHYNNPGIYNVQLSVSNSAGTDSVVRDSSIRVFGPAPFAPVYTDDFETAGTFPGEGYVINNDSLTTWERITTVGFSGTSCVKMSNYPTNFAGRIDSWITPAFDLSNFTSCTLNFRLAYAQNNTSIDDVLKIYYSINCGRTWILRYSKNGATLATVTSLIVDFTPNSQNDWRLETASLGGANGKPNVKFKFEFTAGPDNNLYIDDINVTGSANTIDEINKHQLDFKMAPNPANGYTNISFKLDKLSNVEISIIDLIGKTQQTVLNDKLTSGLYAFELNTNSFSQGLYFVRVKAGDVFDVFKLIVEK